MSFEGAQRGRSCRILMCARGKASSLNAVFYFLAAKNEFVSSGTCKHDGYKRHVGQPSNRIYGQSQTRSAHI